MRNPKLAKLKMLREIVYSQWPAVSAVDPYTHSPLPFVADAIIANPPTFAHIHLAEVSARRAASNTRGCSLWCMRLHLRTRLQPLVHAAAASSAWGCSLQHAWLQALAVPLHMMFPQPWSPTRNFPHPMSGLSNDDEEQLGPATHVGLQPL